MPRSITIERRAYEAGLLDHRHYRIASKLGWFFDTKGEAFPRLALLAEMSGWCERWTRHLLRGLERLLGVRLRIARFEERVCADGRKGRRQKSNRYDVLALREALAALFFSGRSRSPRRSALEKIPRYTGAANPPRPEAPEVRASVPSERDLSTQGESLSPLGEKHPRSGLHPQGGVLRCAKEAFDLIHGKLLALGVRAKEAAHIAARYPEQAAWTLRQLQRNARRLGIFNPAGHMVRAVLSRDAWAGSLDPSKVVDIDSAALATAVADDLDAYCCSQQRQKAEAAVAAAEAAAVKKATEEKARDPRDEVVPEEVYVELCKRGGLWLYVASGQTWRALGLTPPVR